MQNVVDLEELRNLIAEFERLKDAAKKTNTMMAREYADTLRIYKNMEKHTKDFYSKFSEDGKKLSLETKEILQEKSAEYYKLMTEIKKLEAQRNNVKEDALDNIISQQEELKALQDIDNSIKDLQRQSRDRIREMRTELGDDTFDAKYVADYGRVITEEKELLEEKRRLLEDSKEHHELTQRDLKEQEAREKKAKKEREKEDFNNSNLKKGYDKANAVYNKTMQVGQKMTTDPIGGMVDGLNGVVDGVAHFLGPKGKLVAEVIKGAVAVAGAIAGMVAGRDSAMHKMMGTLGMSEKQLDAYKSRVNGMSQNMASTWGKDLDAIVATQMKFQEATGKSILLSEDMLEAQYAMGKVAGDENAMAFTSGMDYFNYSVKDSVDLYYELYKSASKMGLSTQKMTKEMVENLKLAQNYNFKGGVQNMLEMTVLAQKIGMTLTSVTKVAEQLIGGGLQGAIEQSAKLQVLGGQASNMANPLAMLHEAYSDVGSLMDRVSKSLEGVGRFDKNTRQVRFDNVVDEGRVRAIAQSYGISAEEAKKTVNTKLRREDIAQYMKSIGMTNISEEMRESIMNKAQWNQTTKQYEVTTLGGSRLGIDQLKAGDEKYLVANPEGDTMEDFAKKNMSMSDQLSQVGMSIKNGFGMFVYNNFGKWVIEGLQSITRIISLGASGFAQLDLTSDTSKEHGERESYIAREKEHQAMEERVKKNSGATRLTTNLITGANIKHDPSMVYSEGFVENRYRSDRESIREARQVALYSRNRDYARYDSSNNNYVSYDSSSSSSSVHQAMDSQSVLHKDLVRQINNNNTSSGELNLNMNGKITLEGGGQQMDLTETLRRNPDVMRQISRGVVDNMGREVNGGRTNLFTSTNTRQMFT